MKPLTLKQRDQSRALAETVLGRHPASLDHQAVCYSLIDALDALDLRDYLNLREVYDATAYPNPTPAQRYGLAMSWLRAIFDVLVERGASALSPDSVTLLIADRVWQKGPHHVASGLLRPMCEHYPDRVLERFARVLHRYVSLLGEARHNRTEK